MAFEVSRGDRHLAEFASFGWSLFRDLDTGPLVTKEEMSSKSKGAFDSCCTCLTSWDRAEDTLCRVWAADCVGRLWWVDWVNLGWDDFLVLEAEVGGH